MRLQSDRRAARRSPGRAGSTSPGRAAALVAVLLGVLAGVSACTPSQPIGVLKDGDHLVVVIGRQCVPATYLSHLRVYNYDRHTNAEIQPPLWEIDAATPRAVPSVPIGVLPEGFTELANHIADQGIRGTLDVQVTAGNRYATLFDVGKLASGKVLDFDHNVVSERDFRKQHGCPKG
jgi:hypothetical protein